MPVAVALLYAVAAAAILAAPIRAQEAGDAAADAPEASTAGEEAPGEAEPDPENGAVEAGSEGAAGGEAAQDADAGGPVVVDIEEGSVLDDQTFEGVEDDFTPSEEIPVDQAIPFPTDI